MSSSMYLHLFIYLALQLVGAQLTPSHRMPASFDRAILSLLNENNNKQDGAPEAQGERVDKLASAMGDLYWRNQQPDWLYPQSIPNSRLQRSLAMSEGDFQDPEGAQAAGLDGPLSGSRNYHAFMDEFKQYSRLANPSRESRAFKPKLMSTARGFGKRSQQANAADLFTAPASNGKMSGSALR